MRDSHINNRSFFQALCLQNQPAKDSPKSAGIQQEVFELYWITQGTGWFNIDLDQQKIRNNSMYCVFPGQVHCLQDEGELGGYKLRFSEDFLCNGIGKNSLTSMKQYGDQARKCNLVELNIQTQIEIEEIFRLIFWEYHNNCLLKSDILHSLLKLLISYFSPACAEYEISRSAMTKNAVFNKFLRKIEDSFLTEKHVSYYASELSMTPNYLTEQITGFSGFPPRYHIQQRILLEAKRKAVISSETAKSIAYSLGFDDPSKFSKFFKSHSGSNFSEFRSNGMNPSQHYRQASGAA